MYRFGRRLINNVDTLKGIRQPARRFGGGGHHGSHELHVPEFYNKVGTFVLVTCYLWILYKFKADNGQMFGFYQVTSYIIFVRISSK